MKKLLFTQRRLVHHRRMAKVVGLVVLCLLIFNSFFSEAQNPLVKMWDYRFGGDSMESFTCFIQTSDGGFILGGTTDSPISGDKTDSLRGSPGDDDYWIVKTDSLGNKQWDKDFGGTSEDNLISILQTTDGGYILAGSSSSGIGGDKTQSNWGNNDYWIVKIDESGNKQWDKDFGGTMGEGLISIRQTFDGGYILAGNSNSDISGDKTQAHWGNVFTYDYWIVKTDSLGIKQWDKNFGGLGPDELNSIQQTSDGGYIIGGTSASTINGDKTQPNWGTDDFWIVKTDSLGIKQWDKDLGGINGDYLSSIEQTNDGGYIIGGYSYSQISGDKSQNGWGSEDYWIVKTDSICNKQWDKDFGATYFDHLYSVHQTPDGGYLLSGSSTSDSVGDKTENNLGPQQTWFLKTNSIGNKQWDKTVFTLGGDQPGLTIQTRDNCYAVGTTNSSGIGGYKTQPPWNNSSDYWIIKFCDSTLTTNIANTEKENDQLLLWPNPTEGKLAIGSRQYAISTIDIYNTLGELVLTTAVNREPLTVNCEPFPPGIYFVKAFAGEKVLFGKVIKE